jgi:hypothetical protein
MRSWRPSCGASAKARCSAIVPPVRCRCIETPAQLSCRRGEPRVGHDRTVWLWGREPPVEQMGRGSPAQASARRRRASDCTQRWIDALERSALVTNSSAAGAPWRASRQRRGMPVGGTLAPSRPGHLLQPGPVTGVAPAASVPVPRRTSRAESSGRGCTQGGAACRAARGRGAPRPREERRDEGAETLPPREREAEASVRGRSGGSVPRRRARRSGRPGVCDLRRSP